MNVFGSLALPLVRVAVRVTAVVLVGLVMRPDELTIPEGDETQLIAEPPEPMVASVKFCVTLRAVSVPV